MVIEGCHEGKHTPRLTEVKCPRCGEWVEVFVKMGGAPGQTGTLTADETCECGYVFPFLISLISKSEYLLNSLMKRFTTSSLAYVV